MIAERTYDEARIRAILENQDILDRISEDGGVLELDVEKQGWLLMEGAGVYMVTALNATTLEIHAHVLPDHRHRSLETGYAALRWILDNTQHQKVVAEIPTCYPDVIKFTQKFGFVDEGLNRQSIRKKGRLYDQVRLGITRAEIEALFDD